MYLKTYIHYITTFLVGLLFEMKGTQFHPISGILLILNYFLQNSSLMNIVFL